MKRSAQEPVEREVEYDVTKTRKYVEQMIDIANMFSFYEHSGSKILDYEIFLYFHHANKTGEIFDLDPRGGTSLESVNTVIDIWTLIEKKYPKLADYAAVEAYKSVIGKEVFEEVPMNKNIEKAFDEILQKIKSEKVSTKERIFEMLEDMPFLIKNRPEVVKLQNFIRLTRIAHNMYYVALYLYDKKIYKLTTLEILSLYRSEWKGVFYHIPGREIIDHPFRLLCKHQNNKRTGKLLIKPHFMERVLSEIDILQIKICKYCFKIFFAEPRNMKFCNSRCNNRMKSRRYSENNSKSKSNK
jgi:hypothetical protein